MSKRVKQVLWALANILFWGAVFSRSFGESLSSNPTEGELIGYLIGSFILPFGIWFGGHISLARSAKYRERSND